MTLNSSGYSIMIATYAELNQRMRARSTIEHTYTAAFVAASGAACWGVAAIAPGRYSKSCLLLNPAFAVAVGMILLGLLIARAIYVQLGIYDRFKNDQNTLLSTMVDHASCRELLPPKVIFDEGDPTKTPETKWHSIIIVAVAAVFACWFCISIALTSPS